MRRHRGTAVREEWQLLQPVLPRNPKAYWRQFLIFQALLVFCSETYCEQQGLTFRKSF